MTVIQKTFTALVRRSDTAKRIVYAEVYAPNMLDTYGEFMTAEDVELMCHRFMQLDMSQAIDTNHDNVPNGSYPIECWVVTRDDDPEFTVGSWCLGVKCPSDSVWERVLSGELNSFSFEAMITPVEYDVEVSIIRDHVTMTDTQKGVDHEHYLFLQVDERGVIKSGKTSPGPDGHVHLVRHGCFTTRAGNHTHRFNIGL